MVSSSLCPGHTQFQNIELHRVFGIQPLRFVREGNYVGASQQFAYATALAERRGSEDAPLREKLYDAVVAAGIDVN